MGDQLSADLASLRITRHAPPPPRRLGPYVAVAAALGGVAIVARTWAVPYVEARLFKPEVSVTEVTVVSPAQATVDLTGTGYVVAQVVAKVGAKVQGRVVKAAIREGEPVKAGQVLFLLDPADQRSAVASAQARAAAARARAAAARARARVARANVDENRLQFERKKKLAESGAENQASADDLGARVKSLEEQVRAADVEAQAAEAEADAAQAEVTALAVTLGNMTITAPIDGTAVTKPAAVGDVVGPASVLVELADFATLLVEVDVPEGRMGLVKKGGPCEVVLDAYPERRLRGEVVEVSPRLNRAKASGTVKVRIVDAADGVLPEMAARVGFLQKALDAAAMKEPPKKVIPAAAVAERAGAKVAFVVEDGKARLVPLVLGPPFGGGFELKDGPSSGARAIKAPPATLTDGQAIKEKGGDGMTESTTADQANEPAKKQDTLIRLRGIVKAYERGGEKLRVLDGLDLDIPSGSYEALMGPSGSGKSTLLNLIAGLDQPTSGTIEIGGKRIDSMGEGQLAKWRANTIGFVFQSYNLLPVLTAIENVELPLLLTPVPSNERRKRAETALRVVGLEDRTTHYPRQLSGGQEQRVAIARAIVNDPQIIVADEPTGDLDRQSADDILDLLQKLNGQLGKTIVMVTHDPAAAERAGIIRRLNKGTLQ